MFRAPSRLESKALSREPKEGYMRRTLSARIATIVLVATLAAPAIAAPRDDSPIGAIERTVTRVIKQIRNLLPLTEICLPKP
jgi:hypothetical protein